MRKCGNCYLFKNGCDFSESQLPEDYLKNYAACADFVSNSDVDNAMEKAYQIVQEREG